MGKFYIPLIATGLFTATLFPMDLEYQLEYQQEQEKDRKEAAAKFKNAIDTWVDGFKECGLLGKTLAEKVSKDTISKLIFVLNSIRPSFIPESELAWKARKNIIQSAIIDDHVHPDSISYFIICNDTIKNAIKDNPLIHNVEEYIRENNTIPCSPLTEAFLEKDVDFIEFLLSHKTDPSSPNSYIAGASLMHHATLSQQWLPETITLLGKHSSDTCCINQKGHTPLIELAMKATGTPHDCEKAKLLIYCGVPCSRPTNMFGTYKDMHALQIVERRIADTQRESDEQNKVKTELLTCIQDACKEKRKIILAAVHEKLSMDPATIVLSYDE